MRYIRKPKYRLPKEKVHVTKDEDLTPKELYQEQLKSKIRRRRR